MTYWGKPSKTGYSGNTGNRCMQRIVLPQCTFSLPTSVSVFQRIIVFVRVSDD